MNLFKSLLLIGIVNITVSCNWRTCDITYLSEYIANKEHGLAVGLHENGFELEAKYIPSYLSAYQEYEAHLSDIPFDSLVVSYGSCRSFVFTIQTEGKTRNILGYKTSSLDEIKQRQYEVDFRFGQHLYLDVDGERFYPQLCSAQNTSIGGKSGIKVMLTFVAETKDSSLLKDKDLNLYFNDPFFETGLTRYPIKNNDIQHIPKLKIL